VTVDFEAIREAAGRISTYVHRTPVLRSELIDARAGCDIWFKCENLQKVGAFKARGAHNAVLNLAEDERARGVATHSSGNHAAALALAASRLDIPAYIVMPHNAPASKVAAVRDYGGEISFCDSTLAARETTLEEVCTRTGARFVPPYDHPDIIAGQGTTALEMYEQMDPPPHYLITPVGGGGLLAGCAVASRALWPATAVVTRWGFLLRTSDSLRLRCCLVTGCMPQWWRASTGASPGWSMLVCVPRLEVSARWSRSICST